LVLIAPFGLYDTNTRPTDLWAQKPPTLPGLLCVEPKTYTDHMALPEGVSAEEWPIITTRASEAAARLLWPLADTRLERRLHRIRCPTTILWGAEDKALSPSYAERFAKAIAGKTRTAIIPSAGHLADLDQPARVAEVVLTALG
jgi:pimeloyl-ACP methyl ester carboxylesterase